MLPITFDFDDVVLVGEGAVVHVGGRRQQRQDGEDECGCGSSYVVGDSAAGWRFGEELADGGGARMVVVGGQESLEVRGSLGLGRYKHHIRPWKDEREMEAGEMIMDANTVYFTACFGLLPALKNILSFTFMSVKGPIHWLTHLSLRCVAPAEPT